MSIYGDLKGNSEVTVVQAQSTTLSASADSTNDVDKKNWGAVLFLISVGELGSATGTNYYDVVMEDSDDDSTYTAVTDQTVVHGTMETAASGILVKLDAEAQDNLTYAFEYVGTKRYVRISWVKNASAPNITPSVVAVSHNPKNAGESGTLGSN